MSIEEHIEGLKKLAENAGEGTEAEPLKHLGEVPVDRDPKDLERALDLEQYGELLAEAIKMSFEEFAAKYEAFLNRLGPGRGISPMGFAEERLLPRPPANCPPGYRLKYEEAINALELLATEYAWKFLGGRPADED